MNTTDLQAMRVSYEIGELNDSDAPESPFDLFTGWLKDAVAHQLPEPNAMTLSTLGLDGSPNARTVLLKALDDRGFTFFTNYESQKGNELAAHPRAALTFLWTNRQRQVVVRGVVSKLPFSEAEGYFAVRPYGHQIGAWASEQSKVIPDREWLEGRAEELRQKYPEGQAVPCPPHWGGYALEPSEIEFWQGRRSRLHDRIRYIKQPDGSWRKQRLSP
ncbi:MAG: pyridoxamine 5'-phosphate oxidase [Verrucomicrobiaceae bacterium]|nr:pyridoxamine 5'-phosphate oxidase [Verrucomicrobiaceae bacterium]